MSNTALVYRPREIWNTGDIELIDGVYAENFVAYWPASSEVSERIDGFRFGVERIRRAFPDWHGKVLDAFGSGDQGSGAFFRPLELGSNTRRRAGCAVTTCCQSASSP